jgi:multidrug efflux pump
MVLSDISIKRPVLATVMSLAIILLGMISYQRLSVREYPRIASPRSPSPLKRAWPALRA